MKKIWLFTLFVFTLLSCSDSNNSNKNPNIPNYSVSAYLNTNLPAYNNLLYVSNPVYVPNYGAKGLIVMMTGPGTYTAFDAACPNQPLNSCTAMTIDVINAVCSCDKSTYSLYTGLGDKEYPMKQYRVEANGSVIHVYN
jgi:nitrite reductase/ring-hydroxylating ferredoxin subunit